LAIGIPGATLLQFVDLAITIVIQAIAAFLEHGMTVFIPDNAAGYVRSIAPNEINGDKSTTGWRRLRYQLHHALPFTPRPYAVLSTGVLIDEAIEQSDLNVQVGVGFVENGLFTHSNETVFSPPNELKLSFARSKLCK
tara:strand:+ start:210 stop:623 length:414 start_codon:yes stop_codon:yes gene_type:complete